MDQGEHSDSRVAPVLPKPPSQSDSLSDISMTRQERYSESLEPKYCVKLGTQVAMLEDMHVVEQAKAVSPQRGVGD